jgi:hypothetical protein
VSGPIDVRLGGPLTEFVIAEESPEPGSTLEAIQTATRILWASTPKIDPDLVWCGLCLERLSECACGLAHRLAKGLAPPTHTLLAPRPPEPRLNRRGRRAARSQARVAK